jgi:hypothetical protein
MIFSLNMPMCDTAQTFDFFPNHPIIPFLNSHPTLNPTGEGETTYGAQSD